MLQLNFDIFNDGFLKVVLNLEFSDKRFIEKKQSHCYEQVTITVTDIDRFVDLSKGPVVYIGEKIPLKVG